MPNRFNEAVTAQCRRLAAQAWEEDLSSIGDLTSQWVIPEDLEAQAIFVAREEGIISGLPAIELLLEADKIQDVDWHSLIEDGAGVKRSDRIGILKGSMQRILAVERPALNFLQHLSGIATLTHRYVEAIAGLPCQILDTRKTIPGWRFLEKYAVRCGGGHNHRMGLYDGVLIKDNHLAALGGGKPALENIKKLLEEKRKAFMSPENNRPTVEIEVENMDLLEAAFACRPDIVLLDNMSIDMMREAVRRRQSLAPAVLLEASGGVNLKTVRSIAETGVDRISVGALTHSAAAFDIALDYLPS